MIEFGLINRLSNVAWALSQQIRSVFRKLLGQGPRYALFLLSFWGISYSEEIPPNCTGLYELLIIIDRPSVGFSPCPVGKHKMYIESGYSYQKMSPSGYGHNLPQTEMRVGYSSTTEFDFFPPNYFEANHQNGWGPTSFGMKQVLYFDKHQIFTLQGYFTPSSGSSAFGDVNNSFLINGIYGYNFDSGISIIATFGVAANSPTPDDPSPNYYTYNPGIIFGWSLSPTIASYIEFYSQNKTAIDKGWGVSMDAGLIFLIQNNLSVDVTAGQRISGRLNGVDHYYGGGLAKVFDI